MASPEIEGERPEETPLEAPMEGDEGAPELRRHADVGRAIAETLIEDVATSPPVSLPADATVAKAIETMRKKKVGAVTVVAKKRPRRLVGILTERDLLQRVLAKKGYGRLALEKVMTAAPETLRPKDSLAYALNKMSVGRFRHVPLVDERDVPVGMLSIRDVIDFIVELIPEQVLNLPPEPALEVHKSAEGE
jgi:CBS domain-containing protein